MIDNGDNGSRRGGKGGMTRRGEAGWRYDNSRISGTVHGSHSSSTVSRESRLILSLLLPVDTVRSRNRTRLDNFHEGISLLGVHTDYRSPRRLRHILKLLFNIKLLRECAVSRMFVAFCIFLLQSEYSYSLAVVPPMAYVLNR